jgi:ligand-binding sensor domain-containing protein
MSSNERLGRAVSARLQVTLHLLSNDKFMILSSELNSALNSDVSGSLPVAIATSTPLGCII